MLIASVIIIWVIALALPSPRKSRQRRRAQPIERAASRNLFDEYEAEAELLHLEEQRRLYLDLYSDLERRPQTVATKRQMISLNEKVFRIERKMRSIEGAA